jgi:hypothetical protein
MRQFLLPGTGSFIPTGWEVLALVGQTLLYGLLSQLALRYLEQRARHDARLLLRSS